MPAVDGRSPRTRLIRKVTYLGCVLVAAGLVGLTVADRRGPTLGVVAFLVYGSMLGFVAWRSVADLRRWSVERVVLDTLGFVPIAFVALLLIPALAWWAAALIALIALVAGMVFVPLVVRRRNGRLLWRSDDARAASDHHKT